MEHPCLAVIAVGCCAKLNSGLLCKGRPARLQRSQLPCQRRPGSSEGPTLLCKESATHLLGAPIKCGATSDDVNGSQAAPHACTPLQERSRERSLRPRSSGGGLTYLLSTLLGCGAARDNVDGSLAAQNAPHAVACEQQEAVARAEVHCAAFGLRGHAHPGQRMRAMVAESKNLQLCRKARMPIAVFPPGCCKRARLH